MLVDEIEKEPFDEFGYAVRYHQVLKPGEFISTCTLTATLLSTGADVTGTFLASASATIPSDTAASGTVTTIRGSTDLAVIGFKVGDFVINQTKGYSTQIREIIYGAAKNDTLVFGEQAIAAAAADVFSAAKAVASLRAGSDGNRVKVMFNMTTNLSAKFQDEIIVRVKDH